jgi:hypothetical protein
MLTASAVWNCVSGSRRSKSVEAGESDGLAKTARAAHVKWRM